MPLFIYKAVTEKGQVVRNRVEEISKIILFKKLKRNGFMPISVTQLRVSRRTTKSIRQHKKNIERNDSVLKSVRMQEITKDIMSESQRFSKKIKRVLVGDMRITIRDIVIFTQDFYLLKKANFNNIHALSTIIESTENISLRAILEDILLGVESGENMYITMEYYEGIFPPIYINMIKVGELSRFINKSIGTSN